MRAVLIATGETTEQGGLSWRRPLPMLPLLDRPFVQHVVEYFVQQGVTEFDFVLGHLPETLEKHLGDGVRWGCRFTYHLAHVPGLPYAILQRLGVSPHSRERILLGHAHTLPLLRLDPVNEGPMPGTVLFMASPPTANPSAANDQAGLSAEWTGWGVLTARDLLAIPRDMAEENLAPHLRLTADSLTSLEVKTVLRVSSPGELLAAQRLVLDKQVDGLVHAARETRPGIWVASKATVSPKAQLHGPVYIGPDTVVGHGAAVGPHAVVGAGCVIDRACRIVNSAVFDDSYIGEGVILNGAVVDRDLAVNARDRTMEVFADRLTLGSVPRNFVTGMFSAGLRRLLALALLIATLPVLLLAALVLGLVRRGHVFRSRVVVRLPLAEPALSLPTYSLWSFVLIRGGATPAEPCPGAGLLLLNTLPGLINVLRGQAHLVGLMPRTQVEIAGLPEEWRAVYLRSKAGLFAVSALLGPEQTPEERFAAEAAYALNPSWGQDLRIIGAYFWRAMVSPLMKLPRAPTPRRQDDGQVRQLLPDTLLFRADEAAIGSTGSGPHMAPRVPGA